MKKFLALLLSAMMLVSLCAVSAVAADAKIINLLDADKITEGSENVTVNADGSWTITGNVTIDVDAEYAYTEYQYIAQTFTSDVEVKISLFDNSVEESPKQIGLYDNWVGPQFYPAGTYERIDSIKGVYDWNTANSGWVVNDTVEVDYVTIEFNGEGSITLEVLALSDTNAAITDPIVSEDDDEEVVPAEPKLLSAGKSYTYPTEGLYHHWSEDWSCSDNVDTALTDGVTAAGYYGMGEVSGWGGASPNPLEIVVDLEDTYTLTSFAYTLCGEIDGIAMPESVAIYVSKDGENFTEADVAIVDGENEKVLDWTDCVDRTSVATANATVDGRYVKFAFTKTGNFVFINELEVYGVEEGAVVGGGEEDKEPEVIVEEIAVDGDLTDTGWAEDKWIEVYQNAENTGNAYWQEASAVGTASSFKYQLRADDTKLYGAFVVDEVDEAGKVRLWLKTNDEATIYTHFYDITATGIVGKYNTSTTENKGAAIENCTAAAVCTIADGKTYVEFAIDLEEFNGAAEFDYFVSVFGTGKCLTYPANDEPAEGESRTANLPYAVWNSEKQASATVSEIVLGEVTVDNGDDKEEDKDEEKVPGDMSNMIVFALLAVVAIAGSAVVIKTRR